MRGVFLRRLIDERRGALDVAAAAVYESGHAPGSLPSVFTSAHGDLAVNDYMCRTLASTPTLISPTKFHNSVHNAAVGYWTIGTGCMAASNSISAFESSFAAGLLEAAAQCAADQTPVLLVGYDVPSVGALSSVTTSRGLLAVGMVIAPERTERTVASFDWSLTSGQAHAIAPRSEVSQSLTVNAMADALPLFELLALGGKGTLALPLSPKLSLQMRLEQA